MSRRAERHRLKKGTPYYDKIRQFCHLAKNLYNHGNYLIRQEFIENGKWLRYGELDVLLKKDTAYPDYRAMPTAQSAQQTLRLLDRNWKSFFAAIKDWKAHPEKYKGRPKLPAYKRKDGLSLLIMTNQNCKLRDGYIQFPKVFDGFKVKPVFTQQENAVFQQVRFVPSGDSIIMEIIYDLSDVPQKQDNGRYASIDIGVDNLAAMALNVGQAPFLFKGTPLKAINQYYNKSLAKRRSICERMNGRHSSKRITQLTAKRNRKIEDYLHKASKKIIEICDIHDVSTLVIGQNKGWKQEASLGKKTNQHFVQIPFAKFIQMLQYKAESAGIQVVLTEERYTSGTSFLDDECPTKEFYNKSRRVHRGLFRANDGRKINADVNGAFQIMKKVFPNVKADGIEGAASRPTVVALLMKEKHGLRRA